MSIMAILADQLVESDDSAVLVLSNGPEDLWRTLLVGRTIHFSASMHGTITDFQVIDAAERHQDSLTINFAQCLCPEHWSTRPSAPWIRDPSPGVHVITPIHFELKLREGEWRLVLGSWSQLTHPLVKHLHDLGIDYGLLSDD